MDRMQLSATENRIKEVLEGLRIGLPTDADGNVRAEIHIHRSRIRRVTFYRPREEVVDRT